MAVYGKDEKWVVWHRPEALPDEVTFWTARDRPEAFDTAVMLEDDDDVILAIEGPGGVVDLDEFRREAPGIREARKARQIAHWESLKLGPLKHITVIGPNGEVYTEDVSEKYLAEYLERYTRLFGADRVKEGRGGVDAVR